MNDDKKITKSSTFNFRSFSPLFENKDLKPIFDAIIRENGIINHCDKFKDGRYLKVTIVDEKSSGSSISASDSAVIFIIKKEHLTTIYQVTLGPVVYKTTFERRPKGYIITNEEYIYSCEEEDLTKINTKLSVLRCVIKDESINTLLGKISGSPSIEDLRDFYGKYLHLQPTRYADYVFTFNVGVEPESNPYNISSNNYKYCDKVNVLTSKTLKGTDTLYEDVSDLYKGVKSHERLRAIYSLYMGDVNTSNVSLYPLIASGKLNADIDDVYDKSIDEASLSSAAIENQLVGESYIKKSVDYKNLIDSMLSQNSSFQELNVEEYKRR